ncbi:hypothetical protein [Anaeroselena agilis]|uniref:4Fe-4S ferredoxin-type domain-containing protein n=1 Tax=Anaeroselena agilis TaxID=3063788 RepID=A0ABU3P1I4_9FIRM|nr:hypothetical protein [Selenomonadales bacterium 4137-cl]
METMEIKRQAALLGADLCGVAPLERFADAPAGFHPADVAKGCRSVLAVACRFPAAALDASPAAYTFVRNKMVDKLDAITFRLAADLDRRGIGAVPVPSADPCEYWDADRQHGQGILSLKHAAVRAGLGKIGKNTLLVNDLFGNMLWLGAVLVDRALAADPLAAYDACLPGCRACLDACPGRALDGTTIIQKNCRPNMINCIGNGSWLITCNLCRRICPNRFGLLRPQR